MCFAGLCLLPLKGLAQFDEVGVFMGISHYSGDLTERTIEPLGFNQAIGFYLRQKISSRFGLKYQFVKGKLSGDDANSTTESGLWRRNLKFSADLYEVAVLAEYNFFKMKKGAYAATPYVFGGLAGFYFSPFTELDGKSYDLHHYKTEGVAYSLYQFAIPFGAGLKLQVNGTGHIGLQAGMRKTFTDYLDDVSGSYAPDLFVGESKDDGSGAGNALRTRLSYRSQEVDTNAPASPSPGAQRGNPDKNDWYLFFGVTVGMNLK